MNGPKEPEIVPGTPKASFKACTCSVQRGSGSNEHELGEDGACVHCKITPPPWWQRWREGWRYGLEAGMRAGRQMDDALGPKELVRTMAKSSSRPLFTEWMPNQDRLIVGAELDYGALLKTPEGGGRPYPIEPIQEAGPPPAAVALEKLELHVAQLIEALDLDLPQEASYDALFAAVFARAKGCTCRTEAGIERGCPAHPPIKILEEEGWRP